MIQGKEDTIFCIRLKTHWLALLYLFSKIYFIKTDLSMLNQEFQTEPFIWLPWDFCPNADT